MKKQLSQFVKGLILTLLLLGFSYKGSYGEIPVHFKNLSLFAQKFLSSSPSIGKINSLFIQQESLIILIEHDEQLSQALQDEMRSDETPLILSISALPRHEAEFDAELLVFEQSGKTWITDKYLPLAESVSLDGAVNDGQVQESIILLPDWFDVYQPIKISYRDRHRTIKF